jgi:hypothetical protein
LFLSYVLCQKIKNNTFLTLIIFSLFLFSVYKIYCLNSFNTAPVNLDDKKAIVNYLINQKQDQPFNLSYETGIGLDFGFGYLFNYLGNPPQNTDNAHLYTLFIDSTLSQGTNVVFKRNIYSLVRR